MQDVNKVKLLWERTFGVPPVIFKFLELELFDNDETLCFTYKNPIVTKGNIKYCIQYMYNANSIINMES